MKWNITVNLTEEEQNIAKKLCIDLKVGIGAWVAELMRMDMEAHEERNYKEGHHGVTIHYNREELRKSQGILEEQI